MAMGLVKAGVIGLAIILVLTLFLSSSPPAVPKLSETWWGPGSPKDVDKSIKPFKVVFSKEDVNDLKARLNRTRAMTPGLEGAAWTYGLPGHFIPTIVDYWLNKYDFKKREAYLNKYPQFTTNIQGLDIHFLHVKPAKTEGKRVLPLMIQHGWCGSVVEFYKIIPMLTTPRPEHDFVFEVIAPSLPGFSFSSAAVRPGLGSAQIAVVLKNLMLRLGFEKFYTQGGDWGAIITDYMAVLFPNHVLGLHSNMCTNLRPSIIFKTMLYEYFPSLIISDEEYPLIYPFFNYWSRKIEETGYLHIQATKPDTIGIGLTDSPAGLAAYLLEKFSTATNPAFRFKDDGALFKSYSADELIDNLMMYWIGNSITTSMRIYAETFGSSEHYKLNLNSIPIEVPSACAQFPHEISYYPTSFLKERYKNLIRATRMSRGGHFAALEVPELLANDVWTSIEEMEALKRKKTQEK